MAMLTESLRRWRRDRLAAAAAIVVVALGVAATASLFTTLYAVALRPLPFPDSDKLFVVADRNPARPAETGLPPGRFRDLGNGLREQASLAAIWPQQAFNAVTRDGATRVSGAIVSPNVLDLLGRRVLGGRNLIESDTAPDAPAVVLISRAVWLTAFGRREDVIGQSLSLDGVPHQVIGVLPDDLFLPVPDADVWLPLRLTVWNRVSRTLVVLGRRTDGTGAAGLQRAIDARQAAMARAHPETDTEWTLTAQTLREAVAGEARAPLQLVVGASLIVNALVALNLGILLVARVTARRHDLAVRRALGASPTNLSMIGVVDAAVLVLSGSIAGLVLALWTAPTIAGLVAGTTTHAATDPVAGVDWPALAAVLVMALAVSALAAVIPTVLVARIAPFEALRARASATGSGARRLLVVAEVAGALVLLTMTTVIVQRMSELRAVDPGFSPDNVLTAHLSLPGSTHGTASARRALVSNLLARIETLPGVRAAAAGTTLPFGGVPQPFNVWSSGQPEPQRVEHRAVSPDYFATLSIGLVAGRSFTPADRADSEPVAIVSERLGRRLAGDDWRRETNWRLSIDGPGGPWRAIVGVVADTRYTAIAEAGRGELYLPWSQDPWPQAVLVVRHRPGVRPTREPLDEALRAVDPRVPLYDVAPLTERLDRSLGLHRLLEQGFKAFGALAGLIAVFGMSALMAWSVETRRIELGIRTALGASPARLARHVLQDVLALALAGIATGLPLAWIAGRAVGATVTDFAAPLAGPAAAAAAGLTLSVLVAAAPLARRAARTSPSSTLRTA